MKERDCKRDNNHLVNAKRVILSKYNPFIFISAPLTDERCSYNAMIEFVTIRKLKS